MLVVLAILWVSLVFSANIVSAAEPPSLERQRQQAVAAIAPAKAKLLKVSVDLGELMPAKLHPEPLLRWSNATAGSIYGEVFLWSVHDRPVAIASIYRWYDPWQDSTVEVVSMSESMVSVEDPEEFIWNSPRHGVTFDQLPDPPIPAATRSLRLRQMREIAARFSAELDDNRGGENVLRELRLLNQPIHRYVSEKEGISDGALFAFVEGTDPEAWLMLEAVNENGKVMWRYGLVRMNAHPLQIRCDKKVVISWKRIVDPANDRQSPYAYFNFDPSSVDTNSQK